MSYLVGPQLPVEMRLSLRGSGSVAGLPEGSNDLDDLAAEEFAPPIHGEELAQVAVVDGRWNILSVNAAWKHAADHFGQSGLLLRGGNLRDYFHGDPKLERNGIEVMLRGIREIDAGSTTQFIGSYKAGADDCHFQISISVFETDGRRYSTVSRINVSELIELRAQTLSLSTSLMRAQANLMRAQEDERQRVARELHDTAAQHLTGVNLGLARLLAVSSDPAAIAIAEEISDLLAQFHRDLRGVTYVLHPPELRLCGLHGAVRALCDGLAQRSGLVIDARIYGDDRRRGTAVEAALFRLAQEALANIQRHAHAGHVRVRLESRANTLFVVVSDDGIGLPDGWADRPAAGVGMAAMANRVRELGGRFKIRSQPGKGTSIAAAIPRCGAGQAFLPATGFAAA
jgi:signal transduction histidine kinase